MTKEDMTTTMSTEGWEGALGGQLFRSGSPPYCSTVLASSMYSETDTSISLY